MKKITLSLLTFAMFALGTHAAMATFTAESGIVTSLFELSPKLKSYNHIASGDLHNPALTPTTTSDTIFRALGSSVYNAFTASGEARFDNALFGSYSAATVPTAAMQVNGAIEIEQLADPAALGAVAYLCVNDFGVLSRCPGTAIGSAACKTPGHSAYHQQKAVDTATGCDVGEFFDKEDPTLTGAGGGSHEWGCRVISDSIALTPTHPTDISCSHANALPSAGGAGLAF